MSTHSPVLSRRAVLALAALPAGLAHPASAQDAGAAAALVKSTGDQLVAIVNGPGTVAEKRPKLRQVIEANVDVDAIARFALGRFWRVATPEQQRQYLPLFHDVLIINISGNLGDYRGVKFTVVATHARDDGEHVVTIVERPNNPPANVEWVVARTAQSLKIIDVIAEGTSMRLTQRSDYSSYLSRNNNNVQALIDALRQQAAENK